MFPNVSARRSYRDVSQRQKERWVSIFQRKKYLAVFMLVQTLMQPKSKHFTGKVHLTNLVD